MKKLLTVLGAVGMVSSSSALVVSCNDVSDFGYYADSILGDLTSTKIANDDGMQIDMSNYFTVLTYLVINGYVPVKNAEGKTTSINDAKVSLDEKSFENAIDTAVSTVVAGSSNSKDYSYTITDSQNNKVTDISTVQNKETITIKFSAAKDSTKWKGTGSFSFEVFQTKEDVPK